MVPGGVEGQLAEQLAGGRVDHRDVESLDQHQNGGLGMGPPGADVVQPAVDLQGELAVGGGAAGADAVVAAGGPVAGYGFWPGGVGGGGGGAVRQGAVRPLLW